MLTIFFIASTVIIRAAATPSIIIPALAECFPASSETFIIAANNKPTNPTAVMPFRISLGLSSDAFFITLTINLKDTAIIRSIPPALRECSPATSEALIIAVNKAPIRPIVIIPFAIADPSSLEMSFITPTMISIARDILNSIVPTLPTFGPENLASLIIALKNRVSIPTATMPFVAALRSMVDISLITPTMTNNASDILISIVPALDAFAPAIEDTAIRPIIPITT